MDATTSGRSPSNDGMKLNLLYLFLVLGWGAGCSKKEQPPVAFQKLSKKDPVNLSAEWPNGKSIQQEFESSSGTVFPNPPQGARGPGGSRETDFKVAYKLKPVATGFSRLKEVDFELIDFSM